MSVDTIIVSSHFRLVKRNIDNLIEILEVKSLEAAQHFSIGIHIVSEGRVVTNSSGCDIHQYEDVRINIRTDLGMNLDNINDFIEILQEAREFALRVKSYIINEWNERRV